MAHLQFQYNLLNLPAVVTDADGQTTKAEYVYYADGSKYRISDATGSGYVYRGSFVYNRSSTGSETLESVGYDEGRLIATYPSSTTTQFIDTWHVKDYLGSVRVILDITNDTSAVSHPSLAIIEQNDYLPFGMRVESANMAYDLDNRYRYNGKEEQVIGNLNLIDYGARFYDNTFTRWTTPDPLAEKYYSTSPYAFCNNNPVNFVDPDGMNPIYNRSGTLLGTDDGGLHGEALFMDDADFVQSMKHDDALLRDKGIEFLENEEAIDSFQANYTSLAERPDWDGEITIEEANMWYRSSNGQPLFADINKIDLPEWGISKDSPVGQKQVVNTLFGSIRSWLVYGKITLKHYPDNGVRAYSDNYGFEMKKPWAMHLGRNIETAIGSKVAGQGVPYNIHIYGIKYL